MDDILLHYRQLGDIFDTFSMGVMIVGADRKIISLNHSAEIITGHNESDLSGKYCHHILLDPLCGGECQYLDAVEKGRQAGSIDLTVRDRSNEKHSITRIVSPIYGPDETPLGCIEVFQDHSIFKDLLDRVRHDDRRLKIILDNLDIGVLTVDRGGHITFFNTRAETITGFNRGDVLGKSCSMIFASRSSHDLLLLD
ncbi:MAG: PAS domain S-box protein, partial [Desulfobacterales bacterium]